MMRGQKGITLVALVITIIVMLILAGVTISIVVSGDLFGNANQAVTDTVRGQIDEQIQLSAAYVQGEFYAGPTRTPPVNYTASTLAGLFKSSFDAAKVPATCIQGSGGSDHILTITNTKTSQTRTVTISTTAGNPVVTLTAWTP